ncbi:MAG: PqqD family protein [Candidatus Latescibacterota bacterium]|nr:MAG: PqqD family protein [Candidatus Latescibacterota bacterium]
MGKPSKKRPEANLLDLVPERIGEYEAGEDGFVTLLMPRFRNRLMRRLVEPRLAPGRRRFKLKLDDIGTAVWLLIDGKRSVREIAGSLREKFGERIENQCYERLGVFFQQLERGRFISYANLDECLKARD